MSLRKRHLAAITAGAAAISLGMTGGAVTASAAVSPATTRLADSAAPFTATTKATAAAPAAQRVSFQLWLRPNVQAAEAYATAVSTPGNALYHHFLSPTAYTARFAASTSSAHAVESWLKSQGFSVTTSLHGSRQRAYVRATGTVTQVNAAFKTTMALYPSTAEVSAGKAGLETNSKPLAVPSSIAGDLSAVSGLDNVAAVLTLATDNGKVHDPVAGTQSMAANAVSGQQCSTYYGQVVTQDLPTHFGSTAFPTEGCGYSATQLRKAYDVTTATKGGGVTIALVELGLASHMYETLQDYATANNLASPSSTRYFETSLGDDTCGDPFDGEEQLDVESAYALAPSSTEVVIGGDSCNFGDGGLQGLLDADQYVVTGTNGHPVADIASNSWEASNEGGVPTAYTQIMHDFLVQAATEGVTMLFSSGDNSGVEEPSDDPYATAVGGTTLGISQTNSRLFETGWSTGGSEIENSSWTPIGELGADGGGPSTIWAEPSYQKGVIGTYRNPLVGDLGPVRSVPDISADADPYTGILFGEIDPSTGDYLQGDIGGTSLASPLAAGMIADAQAGRSAPFGFINPLLYSLYSTNAYNRPQALNAKSPSSYRGVVCSVAVCEGPTPILTTFDDQNATMSGYAGQTMATGYNNMTGIGTPNGETFITALHNGS